jgi:predicted TIM-barrel fold metal-dependent hydrolase
MRLLGRRGKKRSVHSKAMTLQHKRHLRAPVGCDCHVHIVGPLSRYPQVPDRSYTAGVAAVETLRGLGRPQGVTRFVLVQPSFYGLDNTCVLDALDALDGGGRGVAVVDPLAVTSAQLEDYGRRGVCGVRVNFYSKFNPLASAGVAEVLERFMAVLPRTGWHIEIIANLATVVEARAAIRRATLPIVLDHYGVPGDSTPASQLGRSLLDLLRLPHVWMKLSAPYRVAADPVATIPPAEWLAALTDTAPDRCVWGSDWPHPPSRNDQRDKNATLPYRNIAYSQLLGDFLDGIDDSGLAERILISNPARLYGFGGAQEKGA